MPTMRKAALLLLIASTASAQAVVVMQDGSRLQVESYEVQGGIVVLRMPDGKLHSIPLANFDLEATEALGRVEVVSLRFGWKPGMSARVETDASRERSGGESGAPQRTASRASHRMTVQNHPEGLLVDVDQFELPVLELPAGVEGAGLARSQVERMAAVSPSSVVSLAGEFLKVVAVEEFASEIKSLMAPLRQSIEAEELKALLDRALSEEVLTALMAEQWNLLVGFWIEGDLELGATYALESVSPLPMLPGIELPMRLEFTATQRVACVADAPSRNCVELQLSSYPDQEKTTALVASLVQRFAAQQDAPVFDELHVAQRVTLIAIPETLQPYSLETVKEVRASGKAAGKPFEGFQTERRFTRFHWVP